MSNPALDVDTHRLIRDFATQGLSNRQIVQACAKAGKRVSVGAVHKFSQLAPPSDSIRSNKKRGEFHWREWTPTLEKMQELKKKSSYTQDRAVIELGDGSKPVALAPFSDQHMGAWSTNYQALTELTDELLNTPDLYIGLVGDYGQYSIKLRSVLEVSDNLLPPEQQTDFIESWFEDIWHKVAFATWDNHGVERQEKQAGESGLKRLLSRKVVYFNGIGHIDIKVGDQIYKGAVSHRFRGNSFLNPVHACMRYMRFEGIDREFAIMGDTHTPGLAKYADGERFRVAVNTGSIQNNSGFAKRYFSLTTHPVYPILVFHPDKHEMTPFWSIKEWLAAKKG